MLGSSIHIQCATHHVQKKKKKRKKPGGISSCGPLRSAWGGQNLSQGLGRWGKQGTTRVRPRLGKGGQQGLASRARPCGTARSPAQQLSAGQPAATAYRWRLVASPGAALQRLPQSEHHPAVGYVEPVRSSRNPAAPPLSRDASGVREVGGGTPGGRRVRREGHLTVAAASAPDSGVGRAPLCFAVDCSSSLYRPRTVRRKTVVW